MSQQAPTRRVDPGAVDESAESEIVIHPDGRVFLFGITRGAVEVLAALPSVGGSGRRTLDRIRATLGEPRHD